MTSLKHFTHFMISQLKFKIIQCDSTDSIASTHIPYCLSCCPYHMFVMYTKMYPQNLTVIYKYYSVCVYIYQAAY